MGRRGVVGEDVIGAEAGSSSLKRVASRTSLCFLFPTAVDIPAVSTSLHNSTIHS